MTTVVLHFIYAIENTNNLVQKWKILVYIELGLIFTLYKKSSAIGTTRLSIYAELRVPSSKWYMAKASEGCY